MRQIVLFEAIDSLSIGTGDERALTHQEADELERYIAKQGLAAGQFLFTRHSLRIVNYVGYIQLSTVAIEVLPKVAADTTPDKCRLALLNMLQESGFISISFSEATTQQLTSGSLFEIFGRLFAEQLIKEIRRGLCFCYLGKEENSGFLRGKLLLAKHIGNMVRGSAKVYCAYDEFQVDHTINQFLKQITRVLVKRVRNLYTLDLLSRCLLRFDEVTDVFLTSPQVEAIQLDRTNQRFATVLLLAKLFYHNKVMTMHSGFDSAFSVLFPMNDLFEVYIGRLCQRNLPYPVKIQKSQAKLWIKTLSGRGLFSLKPDILIDTAPGEQIIIDTKWKWINGQTARHGVSREDYFQMYAYLTRYQSARAVVLLYPHHEGLSASGVILERYHLEENPEKELAIVSVAFGNKVKAIVELQNIVKLLQKN